MLKISEIVDDAKAFKMSNAYYWDALNNSGYHIHIFLNGSFVCFKLSESTATRISAKEFEYAVNFKCHLCSIGEEFYYSLFLD